MKSQLPLFALIAALSFTAGLLAQFPVARAAEPSASDLLSQIQALQTRVAALDASVTAARTGPTTEQRLATLQSQLDAIGQVLTIAPSGLTLKTPGSISIEAGSTLSLSGKGTTTVRGSFVRLNGGTKPVSHQSGSSPTVTVP
jgi:hypothetical protein